MKINQFQFFDTSNFCLFEGEKEFSGLDFENDIYSLRTVISKNSKVKIHSPNASQVVAAFISLEGWAKEVHLCPPNVNNPVDRHEIEFDFQNDQKKHSTSKNEVPAQGRVETKWFLYSSGTTGNPKAVEHRLSDLSSVHRKNINNSQLNWGLLYEPTRMAAIQVILHALVTGGRVFAPKNTVSLKANLEFLNRFELEAISATPTIWRQILQNGSGEKWKLRQITLGGEVVDQQILDALKKEYPSARVSHVYASTEVGAAFTIHDGKEGFPVELIGSERSDYELRISNHGTLEIKKNGYATYLDSGDRVRLVDGRYTFSGRNSSVVNIGGAKVLPEEVEKILRKHESVNDAFVYGIPNSMTGNILVAQVISKKTDTSELQKELRKWVKAYAPNYFVPAKIIFCDKFETNFSGKLDRK